MKKLFLIILCVFILTILTNEVLILKDGKTLNGKIIKMDEDTMTVYSKDGEFIIDREDIIEFYIDEKTYQNRKQNSQNIEKNDVVTNKNMVLVKGGEFLLGIKDDKENPLRKIMVNDYFISQYEMTRGEFKEFVNETNYKTTSELNGHGIILTKDGRKQEGESKEVISWMNPGFEQTDNDPVVLVSWYDAIEFCNWKSKKEGLNECYVIDKSKRDYKNNQNKRDTIRWSVECNFDADGFRLPTEAEWEFAYRGGNLSKGYIFSGGNNPDEIGWLINNSNYKTHPVGRKLPNELLLYDMTGNVSEILWDWQGKYSNEHIVDPKGPPKGVYKIIKSSSWFDKIEDNQDKPNEIYPWRQHPHWSWNILGFRVVRSVK